MPLVKIVSKRLAAQDLQPRRKSIGLFYDDSWPKQIRVLERAAVGYDPRGLPGGRNTTKNTDYNCKVNIEIAASVGTADGSVAPAL